MHKKNARQNTIISVVIRNNASFPKLISKCILSTSLLFNPRNLTASPMFPLRKSPDCVMYGNHDCHIMSAYSLVPLYMQDKIMHNKGMEKTEKVFIIFLFLFQYCNIKIGTITKNTGS